MKTIFSLTTATVKNGIQNFYALETTAVFSIHLLYIWQIKLHNLVILKNYFLSITRVLTFGWLILKKMRISAVKPWVMVNVKRNYNHVRLCCGPREMNC